MADITYEYIDNKHSINTYDDILTTCFWIENALKVACKDIEIKGITTMISFYSAEMLYECNSIEEFKRYAFGKEIKLRDVCIWVKDKTVWNAVSVYLNRNSSNYKIVSSRESLISDTVFALKNELTPQENQKEHIVVKHEDKSIHIGDGNTIVGSVIGQENKVVTENKDTKKDKWYSKITWKIIVPILVSLATMIIAAWLGLEN